MYEENLAPLPVGDAATVFRDAFSKLTSASTPPCDDVSRSGIRRAHRNVQRVVLEMCRRLFLPGSGITGLDNLVELAAAAEAGKSCLLCLNHRGNFDVPSLGALLSDLQGEDLFDRIVWIAGRKLEQDQGLTPLLIRGFNRVMITPKSWMTLGRDVDLRESHEINRSAYRALHESRHQGWILGLFPAGTRHRREDCHSGEALVETDTYLKHADLLLLGHVQGCTLPVTKSSDYTHEVPRLDRVRFEFGNVQSSAAWRHAAAKLYPDLSQRRATARAMTDALKAADVPSRSSTQLNSD